MNNLEVLREELKRPGAISWLEGHEDGGPWRAICGAKGCGWACQAPANCPIHDAAGCWHVDWERPMAKHVHDKREQALRCLDRHLVKEHGWKREELGR